MKMDWIKKAKAAWKILRPLVESARKGKKPWLSLTILSNTGAALLLVFNLDAVVDFVVFNPELAKMGVGVWGALQFYLRCHTQGRITLRD